MTTSLKPLVTAIEALLDQAERGIREEADEAFHDAAEIARNQLLTQLITLPGELQAVRFVRVHAQLLVDQDDRLYRVMGKGDDGYVQVLRAIVRSLAAAVRGIDTATLPVPLGVVREKERNNAARLARITGHLLAEGVEETLVRTIGCLGTRGTRAPAYVDRLLDELESFRFIPLGKGKATKTENASTQLMHLLIQGGFNHPRFHRYCTATMLLQVKDARSKEARLAVLNGLAQTIRSLKPLHGERYQPEAEPIDTALAAWIAEETLRVRLDDTVVETEAEYHRILMDLDVYQLAFLAKLFLDEGLIIGETKETYVRKLVAHFSSKGRDGITATSLIAKMTTRDDAVMHAVRRVLERLLERVQGMLG